MVSVEFQQLLKRLHAQPDSAGLPVAALRAASEKKGTSFSLPADVQCTPVKAGGVPAEWSDTPGASREHVLLFLHGGGYYRGSITSSRELAVRSARACGVRGFSVGYRLAPEHPFPAAVDDAMTAYRWLLEQGTPPERIAVAGGSAGAGLAMAVLLSAREEGVPLPAAAVCLSPWVDLTQSGSTFVTNAAADPTISKTYLDRFADMYLNGADPTDPLASPLFADLHGLPPLLIHVGGAETMLDESQRLAAKAEAAGVEVTLEVWPEMTHVWHGNGPDIPEARDAVERIGAFVRARLGV